MKNIFNKETLKKIINALRDFKRNNVVGEVPEDLKYSMERKGYEKNNEID